MRRLIAFPCAGDTLIGTLDEGARTTGLLIVSGGNEIRAGAHRGMALLAQRLAADGFPVFRYDRRGVGDSGGTNTGFEGARDDLVAAAATFRAEARHLTAIVGFGNCDAATALALYGRDAGLARVLLANPWVAPSRDDLPPPAAIRAHYAARLRDPMTYRRLLAGGVSLRRLLRGARRLSERSGAPSGPALAAIRAWGDDATVLLAARDATAIAYADAARRTEMTPHTVAIDTASHSFARDDLGLASAVREFLTARE